MTLKSASRHAVDRYRIVYPDASPTDVLAAAHVAIPIPSDLAHALAGRRPDRAEHDDAEHRIHVEGTGLFVICPLASGDTYIQTFLRLSASEQRRMARTWFLDPLEPLRSAFALGFQAGQAEPAQSPVAVALTRHAAALALLAPRAASAAIAAPSAPAEPAREPAGERPTRTQPPPAPDRPQVTGPAHRPAAPPEAIEPTQTAFAAQLAVACQHHRDLDPNPHTWPVLPPLRARRVMAQPHAGVAPPNTVFRMEPEARWVALYAPGEGDTLTPTRLVSVSRDLRASLLGGTPPQAPEPAPDAPPTATVRRRSSAAAPPARADDPTLVAAAAPPAAARRRLAPTPAPFAAAPEAMPADPPPEPTPDAPHVVDASTLRICAIDTRAIEDLRRAGRAVPTFGALAWGRPVPPHEVVALAARFGWVLTANRAWAARRLGDDVYLIGAQHPANAAVARFARLTAGA